ncbi:MAG: hypothetical protein WC229_01335 [Candidatus Paceibacterota bacterium]|jgi:hypothetical protein
MSQKISKYFSKIKKISIYTISTFIVAKLVVFAGTLMPDSTPTTSTMVTLGDLYEKITNNSYTTSSHPVSTTTSPASTFSTLESIYDAIPDIARQANLIDSTHSLMGVQGALYIPTINQVASGTHFGPNGSLVGTLSAAAVASDEISAWSVAKSSGTWSEAILFCNNLSEGGHAWRLPKRAELEGLVNSPFSSYTIYWSGTEGFINPTHAYGIYSYDSGFSVNAYNYMKTDVLGVGCVH